VALPDPNMTGALFALAGVLRELAAVIRALRGGKKRK
jgi:hypothetical protein